MSSQQIISIAPIVLSVMGIIVILLQNRGNEQGASFFGGGGDTFKLRKGMDQILFISTFVIIIALAVVIYLDIQFIK